MRTWSSSSWQWMMILPRRKLQQIRRPGTVCSFAGDMLEPKGLLATVLDSHTVAALAVLTNHGRGN